MSLISRLVATFQAVIISWSDHTVWLLTNLPLSHVQPHSPLQLFILPPSSSVFGFFTYVIVLFSSWLLKPLEAVARCLSRCPCGMVPTLFLSDLLLLVHCSVNVDIRMEAGLSVSPAFLLSCDCLEATKGRLRQEEMASTLLTCHLRCVSYGHVALKACPSQREPHNENP